MRAAAQPTRVRLLSRPVRNCAVRASTSTKGVGEGQRWRVMIFADCQRDLTGGQSVQQRVRLRHRTRKPRQGPRVQIRGVAS